MKNTKFKLLAFPFGDYEGVRAYLDHMACKGWELTGRTGLLWGTFRPTRRKELYYDVVPADPRRSDEVLSAQVERRREAGWEPVETIWGMDIYQSRPCEEPSLLREEEDFRHWKGIFQSWLMWSAAFLLVTVLSLFSLSHFSSYGADRLLSFWYLSDGQTALVLLLPLLALSAVLWLVWLGYCLIWRCRPHQPAATCSLFLKGAGQLLIIAAILLLPVSLWLSRIPRLWLRLVLMACFLLLPVLCLLFAKEDRKKYILSLGGGVIALFALAMVLSWAVTPVSYNTYEDGNNWRTRTEGISIVTAEELTLDTADSHVTALYDRGESILVTQEHYSEFWGNDLSIELSTYHALLPGAADLLWAELVPAAAEQREDCAAYSSLGWYQLWYRDGSSIYHLSGTSDWETDALWEQAIAIASEHAQ